MILKLKTLHNGNLYKSMNYNDDILLVETNDEWKEFLFQNKERKNNKKVDDNSKFEFKRIKKNLIGFENLISTIKKNNLIESGYFLDYSNFVNIFLYFKDEQEILFYVQDTCEARGDKPVANINDAMNYLKNEGVVISEVEKIFIDENKWNELQEKYRVESK